MAAGITVANGQIIGDPSVYQPWDPTLSQNPDAAAQDNRGCMPGWAAIYVQDSLSGNTVKVCRLLDASVLGPGGAAIIQNESAPNWWNQTTMNVASAAQTVVSGAGSIANALAPFLSGTGLLLVGLVAAAWFFTRGK